MTNSERSAIINEIMKIQRDMNLSDVDMCNYLCTTMAELNRMRRYRAFPHIFNIIMFIASTERPLHSLLRRNPESQWGWTTIQIPTNTARVPHRN